VPSILIPKSKSFKQQFGESLYECQLNLESVILSGTVVEAVLLVLFEFGSIPESTIAILIG